MSQAVSVGNSVRRLEGGIGTKPPSQHQQHVGRHTYLLVTVERPSLGAPWGVSLSMFEGQYVVIGDTFEKHVASLVRGYWSAYSPLDPALFWKNKALDVPSFAKYLVSLPCCPANRTMVPGDCIVAINGNAVGGNFRDLSDVVRFFRQHQRISLVILRHIPSLLAASAVWDQARRERITEPAFYAARAAQRHLPKDNSSNKQIHFGSISPNPIVSKHSFKPAPSYYVPPVIHRNPLFRDSQGKDIPYCDDYEYDPDEGERAKLFLPVIDKSNFSQWLEERKKLWRKSYKVYRLEQEFVQDDSVEWNREETSVPVDFWTFQGYESFDHWIVSSTAKWKAGYSWNRRKRKRLEQDCEEVVHLSAQTFPEWLRVRKNQWRVQRRKRQRQRIERSMEGADNIDVGAPESPASTKPIRPHASPTSITAPIYEHSQPELLLIDSILEEQERERKALETRPPPDISFLFDESLGCPDDVVVHCFQYLEQMEHGKLLCINKKTRSGLMKRDQVWRQLCPDHWKLPRRPRKPWHVIYLTTLRVETERSRKRCDDLLAQASNILLKGDQLQAIEKLVTQTEQEYGFDVNYSSGVVCERNSLLNLAVIHQRHKVVRWLVETKNADIETCDRGQFTPLLNAAWAGDKFLVRFFMQKGADRKQIGTGHYTRPLAPPEFEGLTAEGWAEKRGHHEIAKLIQMGL